jgi:AcrR family transcriptional regulator
MTVETKIRLDRDARREAILDAAQAVFMEAGFAAASMSEIAARVGGSKGTLYNYFKSKEEIFEAYIQRFCGFQQEAMDHLLSRRGDVRETLREVGLSFLRFSLSETALRNLAMVAAESRRAPEIGRVFYAAGPMRGVERLAEFMAAATAEGRLRPCDPLRAAHQFIGLCQNRLLKACLCNVAAWPDAKALDEEVDGAVETFMAAFGPR